jgi:hypothetical protein
LHIFRVDPTKLELVISALQKVTLLLERCIGVLLVYKRVGCKFRSSSHTYVLPANRRFIEVGDAGIEPATSAVWYLPALVYNWCTGGVDHRDALEHTPKLRSRAVLAEDGTRRIAING